MKSAIVMKGSGMMSENDITEQLTELQIARIERTQSWMRDNHYYFRDDVVKMNIAMEVLTLLEGWEKQYDQLKEAK